MKYKICAYRPIKVLLLFRVTLLRRSAAVRSGDVPEVLRVLKLINAMQ